MDNFEAVQIAEENGTLVSGEDEDQVLEAWQHLIDTGLAWELQGFFGRHAMNLIESGDCASPLTFSEALRLTHQLDDLEV